MKMDAFTKAMVIIIITLIVCSTASVCIIETSTDAHSNLYAKTAVVTSIEGDTVVCVDYTGNEWAFDGAEDWMIGDVVSMVMSDMGTPSIYDDSIISMRYGGSTIKE